jgi:hypothetical protein
MAETHGATGSRTGGFELGNTPRLNFGELGGDCTGNTRRKTGQRSSRASKTQEFISASRIPRTTQSQILSFFAKNSNRTGARGPSKIKNGENKSPNPSLLGLDQETELRIQLLITEEGNKKGRINRIRTFLERTEVEHKGRWILGWINRGGD